MRKICIINQKGGVGKTTTTVNLAVGLANNGKRVLVIDLDAQGNVSTCLGKSTTKDIFDILVNGVNPLKAIENIQENLDLVTSKETLTKAEIILAGEPARETILQRRMEEVTGYDYIIVDCPPSLGLLNQNAMLYCDEVMIPVSTDVLGLYGLRNIVAAVEKINDVFNHELRISKIVPTMYDARNKVCKLALQELKNGFQSLVSDPIRICTKIKESPRMSQSIFEYDKRSRGAKDYTVLVKTVISDERNKKFVPIKEIMPVVASN